MKKFAHSFIIASLKLDSFFFFFLVTIFAAKGFLFYAGSRPGCGYNSFIVNYMGCQNLSMFIVQGACWCLAYLNTKPQK